MAGWLGLRSTEDPVATQHSYKYARRERMINETAFLAAIVAAPKDDSLRLVYADWLEERGDTDRAEFIRLQFEAERHEEWTPARMDIDDRADALFGAAP